MNYFFYLTIFFRFPELITRHQHSTESTAEVATAGKAIPTEHHPTAHADKRQQVGGTAPHPPRQQAPPTHGCSNAYLSHRQPTDSQRTDSHTRQHHATTATESTPKDTNRTALQTNAGQPHSQRRTDSPTAPEKGQQGSTARPNSKQQQLQPTDSHKRQQLTTM